MGAGSLGSRAIIGEFYRRLEQNEAASVTAALSNLFQSDQASETYKWLGQVPQMREWIGGRQAKGFSENGITIVNKKYESTLEVLVDEIRRDKTGQVMIRIGEQARRAGAHWFKLLCTLIVAGESALCYDGQFFFDTDHAEGDSGTQDNDIAVNISTATAPTAAEMELAILTATDQILRFVDNEGEPMNEDARQFLVAVPTPFRSAAAAALKNPIIVDGSGARTNTIVNVGGFGYEIVATPRLNAWTTKFALFRTDADAKALIRQEELPIQMSSLTEGSELEFEHDKHQYGIKALRNVGYGMWQNACLVTFT